jgi:hypothetical protein
MKPLFILGITPRCGSNYLANLLNRHEAIERCGIVGEDFLTYHLPKLLNFSDSVKDSWSKVWKWNEVVTPESQKRKLNQALRDGLYQYLRNEKESHAQFYATHTPYTHNLKQFSQFFTGAKLIILVRSGLDAVESGVIGDFWNYRRGINQWAESAKRILAHKEKENCLVLQYENLVKNPREELGKAFNYVGLDQSQYDFDAIDKLPVFGSSTTKQKDGSFKWQRSQKGEDFNPLNRAAHWPEYLQFYFEQRCGSAMRALGYNFPQVKYSWVSQLQSGQIDIKYQASKLPIIKRLIKSK